MSATFQPVRGPADLRPVVRCTCPDDLSATCPAHRLTVNLNERNAADLLVHLGLAPAPSGAIEARRLVALCTLRLAMYDAEEPIEPVSAGRVHTGGRPAGYLQERTRELFTIARAAGDGWVGWS